MRVLQLSDPHLLADPQGRCRGRLALACLDHGWRQALAQLGSAPDLLLISGDLCQDESWGGYGRLREWLAEVVAPLGIPAALLEPLNIHVSHLLQVIAARPAGSLQGAGALPGPASPADQLGQVRHAQAWI